MTSTQAPQATGHGTRLSMLMYGTPALGGLGAAMTRADELGITLSDDVQMVILLCLTVLLVTAMICDTMRPFRRPKPEGGATDQPVFNEESMKLLADQFQRHFAQTPKPPETAP